MAQSSTIWSCICSGRSALTFSRESVRKVKALPRAALRNHKAVCKALVTAYLHEHRVTDRLVRQDATAIRAVGEMVEVEVGDSWELGDTGEVVRRWER